MSRGPARRVRRCGITCRRGLPPDRGRFRRPGSLSHAHSAVACPQAATDHRRSRLMSVLDRQMSATAKIFPHPLNAWYVAAWDHEVTSKAPLARTVADRRSRCTARRTAPGRAGGRLLASTGAAVDGQARRHGRDPVSLPRPALQLRRPLHRDAGPGDDQPQRDVPSYPAVERYRFVWVWLGDLTRPTRTHPGHVPDGLTRNGPVTARPSPSSATTSSCWTT